MKSLLPCLIVFTLSPAAVAAGNEKAPLHQVINRRIAAGWETRGVTPAQPASDEEFLRRITVDLIGRTPTCAESNDWLEAPLRRAELIDKLLSLPEYARNLQYYFDALLMERRADRYVSRADWEQYLFDSFAENKPWDVLVREILSSDGTDADLRPAAKFYLERAGDTHTLVRDVGRLFLGVNRQCAQCHDHPVVGDYEQSHYYGLFAFLNRSYLFTDRKLKKSFFAEKGEGEVTYQSVFDSTNTKHTATPVLLGRKPVQDPAIPKGEEYFVKPEKNVRPVPKYSRRMQLARQLPHPNTQGFSENIVNRLWANMMGRGLFHPLDKHHQDNPPSHPELLKILAEQFEAHQYDVKWFLRELALSDVYQLSSEYVSTADAVPVDSFAVARPKPMRPEALAWSVLTATGFVDTKMPEITAAVKKKDPKFGEVLLGKPFWLERQVNAKMANNVRLFVTTFGAAAGVSEEEFQSSMAQALFMANNSNVQAFVNRRAGNLCDRLVKLDDDSDLARQLYLSVLTRKPNSEETADVVGHLSGRADQQRTLAVQELIWALLASAEFRFNH